MYLLISVGLLCTVCALIYRYFQRTFDYWPSRSVPHLKPSFPFGNLNRKFISDNALILRDIYCELKKTGAKYGGYNILTVPVFLPLSPELYKDVLIKKFNCFQDHGMHYDEENDPMSAILVSLTGAKWKFVRSKLSVAFTTSKLKNMFSLMKESSTKISNILTKSEKLEIHDLAVRYTTDIICSCAFGIEANSLGDKNTEFIKHGKSLLYMNFGDTLRFSLGMFNPQILKIFGMRIFPPQATNFFYKVVRDTVEYREKNNVRRNDLMDSLIQLKNKENVDDEEAISSNSNDKNGGQTLTLNQIAAQVFFFYWAGFETSASTLTCCLYLLAKNPNIQQKLRNEILKTLQENNGDFTFEAVQNMSYADKVLQETMRMYPPVLMLNRICTEDYVIPKTSTTIEKGTLVTISILGVHYDPEYYPEPHKFDPERFSEEEKAKRPDMTYFPFGDGPRICLGYKFAMIELKIALVQFLRNTKYSLHHSMKSDVGIRSYVNLLGLTDEICLVPTKI